MSEIVESVASAVPAQIDTVLDLVDQMLGPDGLAVAAGYRHNPLQWDYSRRVARILGGYDNEAQKTSIGMLEAGTGLGKTLGYLAALFAHSATTGERVAISTHSRQLQRQMFGPDAENVGRWVADLTGVNLTVARRVGRHNYLSLHKIERLIHDLKGKRSGVRQFLEDLLAWGKQAGGGVLDDYLQDQALELPAGLSSTHLTLSRHTDATEADAYRADVEASKRADVLVINHSLLVLHAFRWGSLLDDPERPVKSVVVDEAHKLPGIAESVLSQSLSVVRFRQIVRQLSEQLPAGPVSACQALHDELENLQDFLSENHKGATFVTAAAIKDLPERLANTAAIAQQAGPLLAGIMLSGSVQKPDVLEMIHEGLDHCYDLTQIASALTPGRAGTAIVSWSPVKEYPSLSLGAPEAAQTMSRLWAPLPTEQDAAPAQAMLPPRPLLNAILFTSATLGVPGEALPKAFDGFSRQLGINRFPSKATGLPVHNVQVELMARHIPDVFGSMQFVLADPSVKPPTRKELNSDDEVVVVSDPVWLTYSANMLVEAHTSSHDRVLALTLSWRDTIALAECVREQAPGIAVIEHKQGESLRAVLDEYRNTPSAVLITPSGWEGVDLPGMVPNVFIHRIPFLPPNRNEQMRLRLHLREIGYSHDAISGILHKQDHESARQMLAQGLGRGIRAVEDRCCVWIADPRFPHPESWLGTFDPELEQRIPRRLHASSRDFILAIPERFRADFEQAVVYLESHGCYKPEVI